jgi:putative IMPACT (imprinted ancient) family translation regulator
VELVELTVQLDYGHVDTLRQLLPSFEAEVAAQEFLARVTYTLRLPRAAVARFRRAVADATRGQAVVEGGDDE